MRATLAAGRASPRPNSFWRKRAQCPPKTSRRIKPLSPQSRPLARLRVDCIAGARPNFVKIAPILRALKAKGMAGRLVHTGQHYDQAMSDVFFAELGIPEPDINLGVGSGTATVQTRADHDRTGEGADKFGARYAAGGRRRELYGGRALVAAKLLIPIAHVEVGLRSGDWTMPEEVNRVVTDRLSNLLLTTEREAEDRLLLEGVPKERIHFVGNVMIELFDGVASACPAYRSHLCRIRRRPRFYGGLGRRLRVRHSAPAVQRRRSGEACGAGVGIA